MAKIQIVNNLTSTLEKVINLRKSAACPYRESIHSAKDAGCGE